MEIVSEGLSEESLGLVSGAYGIIKPFILNGETASSPDECVPKNVTLRELGRVVDRRDYIGMEQAFARGIAFSDGGGHRWWISTPGMFPDRVKQAKRISGKNNGGKSFPQIHRMLSHGSTRLIVILVS